MTPIAPRPSTEGTSTGPATADIVERLRAQADAVYLAMVEPVADRIAAVEREAADTIAALRAELAQAIGEMADQGPYINKLRAQKVALRAQVAEWERLRDPQFLHINLLRGIPAKLTREQLLHLAGNDPAMKD